MLHLDGFCDCCDGLSAMTDKPEKRLEIMKDPCVGSSAAGAAIILIFGKGLMIFILVWLHGSTMSYREDTLELIVKLISVPVFARMSIVLLAYKAKYPREKGTGSVIVGNISTTAVILSMLSLIPIIYYIDFLSLKITFCMIALSVIYWRRTGNDNFNGITGDVLGACCETTEVLVLLGYVFIS